MESAEVGELLVKVRADIKELKATLGESKNELSKFGKETGSMFSQVGKELAAAFALSKIKDFVIGSIKEFAALESSMDGLRRAVERNGMSWQKAGDSLSKYIDKAEETTRFNDNELADSLSNLINKTKDVSVAMALNDKAMDLAVGAKMSLAEASNVLAMAYQGNERGLGQLARALGVAGDKAKDAEFLFKQLDKSFKGFAGGEDNLAQDIKLLGTEFGNLKEDILTDLAPGIKFVLELTRDFVTASREAWRWWKELVGVVDKGSSAEKINEQIQKSMELIRVLDERRQHEIEILKIVSGTAKTIQLKKVQALDEELRREQARLEKISGFLKKEEGNVKQTEDEKLKARIKANQEALKAEEAAQKAREKAEREALRKQREMEEERKRHAQEIASAVSGAFQEAAGQMVRAFQEGNLTVEKSFELLGKSIFKSMVKALGEALIQIGVKYNVEALAALATGIGAAAAPGLFAAGGIAAAAGGTMIGVADAALAEGGVVTRPTRALIGEGGEPEAVVPLSKAGAFGFGGGSTTINAPINLPNVRRPEDFASPSSRRTISRVLMQEIQKVKDLNGLRLNNGVS